MTPLERFYHEIRKVPIEDHELEKVKQILKKKHLYPLILTNFGTSLTSSKKRIGHRKVYL